jgi:nucleoside diphosphate kinase
VAQQEKVFTSVSTIFEGLRRIPPYQRTFGIIKPDAVAAGPDTIRAIMSAVEGAGLTVVGAKFVQLDDHTAGEFYIEHAERPFYPALKEFMTSGPAMVMVIEGSDAILSWRTLMGPTNSLVAKEKSPTSLRSLYGTDGTQNATHGSDSEASAMREINYFYLKGQSGHPTEIVSPYHKELGPIEFCEENTFAMIKPGTSEEYSPEIRQILMAHGFTIVSEIFLTFTEDLVEQFYAEHLDKSFFPRLSEYMTSGPVIGLQLKRIAAIKGWRQLIGPTDLNKCRAERGDSIRALFAMDGTRNAVHGSDSPEAALRELKFLFGIGSHAPVVYPPTSQRALRWEPPKPIVSPEKPPSASFIAKQGGPKFNIRDHKKMARYLRTNIDPVVKGLVQRAMIKKPSNMLDFAMTDLAEQKRMGVGVKLPPLKDGTGPTPGGELEGEGADETPLPASLDDAHAEIRELRASVSALSLSMSDIDGLDAASYASMDDSVLTEAAIAHGFEHFF